MFAWWGRQVVSARWWVLAASMALVVVGGTWGTGVFGSLSGGGFDDRASPSSRAHDRIDRELGRQGQDLRVLYSSPSATVDEAALSVPVRAVLADLRHRPEIAAAVSYYDTRAPGLVSADRHATYVAIQLRGGNEDAKLADLDAIRPVLAAGSGVSTQIGGLLPFLHDANSQIESDIVKAELVSMPILLILMIFIFRGLVAAATPMLVGVLAILGAFTVTRVLATLTEVSVFAANVITMLGLGMAIDYALFVVSRFREELRAGQDTPAALARTIATAGRTVMVSGLTVALALASLLLFPMNFLKSMGYGGMAAVLVAMVAALTALPALLAVLGPRIDACAFRRLGAGGRTCRARGTSTTVPGRGSPAVSCGRPVLYLLAVTVVLAAMAAPFLRAEFGGFDERVLPVGTQSRTVAEHFADWLGFTSTGFPEPTDLILMLAVLFGLSTDYEIFLLSRVREEWDASGDNRIAVAAGLQRTGGIITVAALLLIVVIGGFATGGAATIKLLGVGTLVAIAVDAGLVRTLLVPATMRPLGRFNWWAPGPLARAYRRYGLRDSDGSAPQRQPEPAGLR